MSELIEHGDDGNKNIENTRVEAEPAHISLKTYQDIYHKITGRTEQIRQRYSENMLIDFSEIEQLHFKVMQLCDVYDVIANNELISIFHEKERKEQFTSFERFKKYNFNTIKPTINVVLRYNFSILLSDRKQPQEYILTIRLTSRVGLLNSIEDEVPAFMRGRLLRLSADHTAEVTVEYADYVIARSFIEAFDEWVKGCNTNPDKKLLKGIQDYSHFIPKLMQLILVAILFYFFFKEAGGLDSSASLDISGRFFIFFLGAFYFINSISEIAGKVIERSIDNIHQISYLKLNKGDEKIIEKFSGRNTLTFIKFFVASIFTVVLGVISSKLAVFV